MAVANWAADAGSTYYTEASGTTYAGGQQGSASDCYDENEATYFLWSDAVQGPALTAHILFEVTFDQPITVSRIKIVHAEVGAYGGASWSVEYYDGSWHEQGSGTANPNGGPDAPITNDYTSLNLQNVTKVRYTGDGGNAGSPGPPTPPAVAGASCNELYVYGTAAAKSSYAIII